MKLYLQVQHNHSAEWTSHPLPSTTFTHTAHIKIKINLDLDV